jgi:hypothetical protein
VNPSDEERVQRQKLEIVLAGVFRNFGAVRQAKHAKRHRRRGHPVDGVGARGIETEWDRSWLVWRSLYVERTNVAMCSNQRWFAEKLRLTAR